MLIDTLIYLSGATRTGAHMVCCLFIIGQKKLKRLVLVSRGPFSPNLLCLIRNKIEFAPPAITAETRGDALWFLSVPVIDRHYLQKILNNDNCTVQTFDLSLYSTHISFCLNILGWQENSWSIPSCVNIWGNKWSFLGWIAICLCCSKKVLWWVDSVSKTWSYACFIKSARL